MLYFVVFFNTIVIKYSDTCYCYCYPFSHHFSDNHPSVITGIFHRILIRCQATRDEIPSRKGPLLLISLLQFYQGDNTY